MNGGAMYIQAFVKAVGGTTEKAISHSQVRLASVSRGR